MLRNLSQAHNGSAWALSYRDADTVIDICAGFSDIATQTPCSVATDVYAWGSATKPGTAALVLRLADKGVISLDAPFLPLANPFLLRVTNGTLDLTRLYDARIGHVTVRQLLQHSSGLTEYDDEAVRLAQNGPLRETDLSPGWIINGTNRSFVCDPGTCGCYSSTNFVLLGLVLAQAADATSWDVLDQRAWVPVGNSTRAAMFDGLAYAVHGPVGAFETPSGGRGSGISGYQPVCRPPPPGSQRPAHRCVPLSNESDVRNMSSTQGWTCGNMMAPPRAVAAFFYELLGPPSRGPDPILSPESLAQMLKFKNQSYFGHRNYFGYGLGMMNFTSMDWGFANEGLYYGHNGLTYGFGSQQGYNYDLEFSASWVNNWEVWIGPNAHGVPNALYTAMCAIVRKHRARAAAAL